MEKVILVDKNNKELGFEEKLEAHKKGLLHRAFSIFVFNQNGELLLQQRDKNKYHSGGLWTNTVCSHPKPDESYEKAVHRRLKEEMGFDCELKKVGCFTYRAEFDNGLTENEYDCVFMGIYDSKDIYPDKKEVEDYKWIKAEELIVDTKKHPKKYTPWFKEILFGEKKLFEKICSKL